MFKKIALAFFTLFLLNSCSSCKKPMCDTDSLSQATQNLERIGDRVFFGFDSSDLSSESREVLDRQADCMKQHSFKVVVEGHCDERGTREYNLALGERRANSARNYLLSKGLDSERVSTVSYGKERPAVDGHNEEAYSKNRRAVTTLCR